MVSDWEQTPISAQVALITLWQVNGSLKPQVTVQQEQITRLESEVARAQADDYCGVYR